MEKRNIALIVVALIVFSCVVFIAAGSGYGGEGGRHNVQESCIECHLRTIEFPGTIDVINVTNSTFHHIKEEVACLDCHVRLGEGIFFYSTNCADCHLGIENPEEFHHDVLHAGACNLCHINHGGAGAGGAGAGYGGRSR